MISFGNCIISLVFSRTLILNNAASEKVPDQKCLVLSSKELKLIGVTYVYYINIKKPNSLIYNVESSNVGLLSESLKSLLLLQNIFL